MCLTSSAELESVLLVVRLCRVWCLNGGFLEVQLGTPPRSLRKYSLLAGCRLFKLSVFPCLAVSVLTRLYGSARDRGVNVWRRPGEFPKTHARTRSHISDAMVYGSNWSQSHTHLHWWRELNGKNIPVSWFTWTFVLLMLICLFLCLHSVKIKTFLKHNFGLCVIIIYC